MTIESRKASAALADVEAVVARVKQSRIYRAPATFSCYGACCNSRVRPCSRSRPIMGAKAGSVSISSASRSRFGCCEAQLSSAGRFPWRLLGVFALFYGFGYVWANVIGDMGERQQAAFWPTLFELGYCVAGLWFGFAFLAIGLGAAALTLVAFLLAGPSYWLLLTAINGGALIAVGLWMQRA